MSSTPARIPGRKGPNTKPKPKVNKAQDPVEVYCRIRPLRDITDVVCVRRYNETVAKLSSPSSNNKDIFYTFKHAFVENVPQRNVFCEVALPLVEDVLNGKDSLLFTYGITSSGKTHTITGSPQDNGVLPRCLDVIFNSIKNSQSRKFTFKPDGQNFFEIQTTPDALLEWQRERQSSNTPSISVKTPRQKRKEMDENKGWENRNRETNVLELMNSNNVFAIFISYVEIYNNYIYDLLDDNSMDNLKIKNQQPQSKSLREDNRRKVYINKLSEVEVTSADEAFELFNKGVRRRRIAHTALNTESSRSHSVFNIRIVQAPQDAGGEVILDPKFMSVSQLSLVDLAGSERTGRTGNKGDRLREAGNINNSLMALRNCIEILRENQSTGTNKIVPYRDTKLTYLFKSYLDGEGRIRMIICVNPGAEDYDETLHVMKFAEISQEVMITRAIDTPFKYLRSLPDFYDKMNAGSIIPTGPPLPTSQFITPDDDKIFHEWIECFEERKRAKKARIDSLKETQIVFRMNLAQTEQENMTMKQRMSVTNSDLEAREHQIKVLESKCNQLERASDIQNRKLSDYDRKCKSLEKELSQKKRELDSVEIFMEKMKGDSNERLQHEKDRLKSTFSRLLADKQYQLEREKCVIREKMHLVNDIFNPDSTWNEVRENIGYTQNQPPNVNAISAPGTPNRTQSTISANTQAKKRFERCLSETKVSATQNPTFMGSSAETDIRSEGVLSDVPIANPRHRRSLSSGTEKWIDHRPLNKLDLGTVMQPKIKNKKSLTNLKKLGPDGLKSASKYALTHHSANPDGDVETNVYKGEVIPTAAGGAQVIFQDVETLTQSSPPGRKRSMSETIGLPHVSQIYDLQIKSPALSKRTRRG